MNQGSVLYVPSNRGFANVQGSPAVRYLGSVYRIPRADYGTIRQLEWERTPDELLQTEAGEGHHTPQRMTAQMIERVEVCDSVTGDVWVMYRIPCTAGSP